MIDRIVHHADVPTLRSSSYRLKDTGIEYIALRQKLTVEICQGGETAAGQE